MENKDLLSIWERKDLTDEQKIKLSVEFMDSTKEKESGAKASSSEIDTNNIPEESPSLSSDRYPKIEFDDIKDLDLDALADQMTDEEMEYVLAVNEIAAANDISLLEAEKLYKKGTIKQKESVVAPEPEKSESQIKPEAISIDKSYAFYIKSIGKKAKGKQRNIDGTFTMETEDGEIVKVPTSDLVPVDAMIDGKVPEKRPRPKKLVSEKQEPQTKPETTHESQPGSKAADESYMYYIEGIGKKVKINNLNVDGTCNVETEDGEVLTVPAQDIVKVADMVEEKKPEAKIQSDDEKPVISDEILARNNITRDRNEGTIEKIENGAIYDESDNNLIITTDDEGREFVQLYLDEEPEQKPRKRVSKIVNKVSELFKKAIEKTKGVFLREPDYSKDDTMEYDEMKERMQKVDIRGAGSHYAATQNHKRN